MCARHGSTRRGPALAAVLLGLTLTAACASSDGAESAGSSSTPTATPTATPTVTEEPSTEEPSADVEAAPIEGTWTTPTLEKVAFRQALDEQGLGAHSDVFVSDLGTRVALTLEIGAGFWTLYAGVDDQPRTMTDRGTYELDRTRVTVRPNSGGENVFRWAVRGDELTLSLVSTSEPPYEGVPGEVFQRGFYTTSAFVKES